jgi:hypothetical protein
VWPSLPDRGQWSRVEEVVNGTHSTLTPPASVSEVFIDMSSGIWILLAKGELAVYGWAVLQICLSDVAG